MDKLSGITLILISIIEKGIAHAYFCLSGAWVDEVFQLFVPDPVVGILACEDGLITCQLVNHVNVVNYVQDESLGFGEKKSISFVIERCVVCELPLQILLVVRKFALLHGLSAGLREVDHFREATYL